MQRLMQVMGLQAMVPGPHTSTPHPEHPIYPYLLGGIDVVRPNQVWATDTVQASSRAVNLRLGGRTPD